MKNTEKKLNILIADDDRDFCHSLDESLGRVGFSTSTAHEGVRVLEVAHRQHPDLILLDLQMPAGTGRTVLQALRSQDDTKKIPVIVITGLEDPSLEDSMLAEGASGFLKKPFETSHLLTEIQYAFSGKGT